MAFCHSKILCGFCTTPARLWRLNNIHIFQKKIKRLSMQACIIPFSFFFLAFKWMHGIHLVPAKTLFPGEPFLHNHDDK